MRFHEPLLLLLKEMSVLDTRHVVATWLHPSCRALKQFLDHIKSHCHNWARKQVRTLCEKAETEEQVQQCQSELSKEKLKGETNLFSRFELGNSDEDLLKNSGSGNERDEIEYDIKNSDELDRYLLLQFDKIKKIYWTIRILEKSSESILTFFKIGKAYLLYACHYHICQSWKLNSTIELLHQLFNWGWGWGREGWQRCEGEGVLGGGIYMSKLNSTIQLRGRGGGDFYTFVCSFFFFPASSPPFALTITSLVPHPHPSWSPSAFT